MVIDFHLPELERVADKVVFGSDWPGMSHIMRNIEIIRGLPLKEETKEKISVVRCFNDSKGRGGFSQPSPR